MSSDVSDHMRGQLENALRLGGLEADIIQVEERDFVLDNVRVMAHLDGTHSTPAGASLTEIAAEVKEAVHILRKIDAKNRIVIE